MQGAPLCRESCYDASMTTVEVCYRYEAPPSEQAALALARARDVYGIRQITLDRETRTVRVEYDATRLNAATVKHLIRVAGIEIAEELPAAIAPPLENAGAANA